MVEGPVSSSFVDKTFSKRRMKTSTNKTPNLNLHSWVETDPVKMSEFNENFNALDSSVGEINATSPVIVTGTYSGDATTSKTLFFPKTPRFVVVRYNNSPGVYNSLTMINANENSIILLSYSTQNSVKLVWTDNSVTWTSSATVGDVAYNMINGGGYPCHYFAVCA